MKELASQNKLTPAQVIEVAERAAASINHDPHLRMGQALMNALHAISPATYHDVTKAEEPDCFYLDHRIPAFWKFIA
jgi:hypothetical protein